MTAVLKSQWLQEILDSSPLWISPSGSLTQAVGLLASTPVGASYLLVGSREQLLGLVTEREIWAGLQMGCLDTLRVEQVMLTSPPLVSLEQLHDLSTLVEQMQQQQMRLGLVVDTLQQVVGVVRLERLQQICLRFQQQQAELERQGALQFRSSIERSIPIGIAAADFSGRQTYVNDTFAQMLGWPKQELLGQMPPYIYWPPEEIEAITQAFEEGLARGRPPQGWELIFRRRNGERFPVRILDAPVEDGQGNLIGMMASVQDISAEKQALSQNQFQAEILAQIHDVVIAVDTEQQITYWNNRAVEVYGLPAQQALGRPLAQVIRYDWLQPEDQQQAWTALETTGVWQGEVIHHRHSGEPFPAEISVNALRDPQGHRIGFLAVIRDVTDRKQVERHLQESELRFQNLVANIPGAVFQYLQHPDNRNQVLYMSPGCTAIWEVDADQVQQDAQILWNRVHPDDLLGLHESVLSSARTLQPWNHVWRITTPSGQQKWLQGAGQPRLLENGDVLWDSMILDITDRKQTEVELQQQLEQTRLRNELTQGIRQSLNLQTIFNSAAKGIGQMIAVDQVTVTQYLEDKEVWLCLAEYNAYANCPSATATEIPDQNNPIARQLKQGEIIILSDPAQITDPVNQQLALDFPGTWLILPIQIGSFTWGCVALHDFHRSREWPQAQIELLVQVVDQLGIAIQQAQMFEQLTGINSELSYQVEVRNAELHQMVNYERLLRLVTEEVRSSLDQREILQAAVRELRRVLRLGDCSINELEPDLIDDPVEDKSHGDLIHRSGTDVEIDPTALNQLQQGHTLYVTIQTLAKGWCTVVACPIGQEDGVFRFLKMVRPPRQGFLSQEIRLAEQVANQCAIGIRQAQLYQSVQQQVDLLMELNEMKEEFLNLVSHELRTPLTSMKMALTMMEVVGITDSQRRYFDLLKQEWQKELQLVNNLLDLQRLESGKRTLELTQIDLQTWLLELLTPFALRCQEHQLDLAYSLPDPPQLLMTDPELLTRILSELINNAIKYTPPQHRIEVSVALTQETIQFQVLNTGIQIPPDQIPLIFEKFHRVTSLDRYQQGGTGLGLPLVRKGVELLGGEIAVTCPEESTCFCVLLPRFCPEPDLEPTA